MNRQSGLACPPRPARGPQKGCVPAREQELLGTSPSQATAPVTSDRNAPANCCLHGRRLTIGRPVEISPALPGSWTSAAPPPEHLLYGEAGKGFLHFQFICSHHSHSFRPKVNQICLLLSYQENEHSSNHTCLNAPEYNHFSRAL